LYATTAQLHKQERSYRYQHASAAHTICLW